MSVAAQLAGIVCPKVFSIICGQLENKMLKKICFAREFFQNQGFFAGMHSLYVCLLVMAKTRENSYFS
jgi:hypothetical protein